jgi:hypothetical protein
VALQVLLCVPLYSLGLSLFEQWALQYRVPTQSAASASFLCAAGQTLGKKELLIHPCMRRLSIGAAGLAMASQAIAAINPRLQR